ncbi:MAG: hypothetical protein WBD78_10775, partial [Methylocella sp.]
MTKNSTEPADVAADVVLFGDGFWAHDDATKTCREFTLEGIGEPSNGYAPKQRREHPCHGRRGNGARPAIVAAPATELLDRPRRRPFAAQGKLRFLGEADRAAGGAGATGAIVRREGLC